MEDDYIQELIMWPHPEATPSDDFHFTDEENMTMLRLPRKECSCLRCAIELAPC